MNASRLPLLKCPSCMAKNIMVRGFFEAKISARVFTMVRRVQVCLGGER